MPEGPEVKTITNRLNQTLAGRTINRMVLHDAAYARSQMRDEFDTFRMSLPLKIESVNCKGKFIYWKLENNWVIFHTLGMSGTWRFTKGNTSSLRGIRVSLETDGQTAHYKDTRKFGTFKFFQADSEAKLEKKLQTLGPDMLSENVSEELFIERFRKRNHYNICKALMDQKIVSGIGNYIKAEALYKAKINPHATVEDLTDTQLRLLCQKVKSVIYSSYQSRGASFRDYVIPDGSVGTYAFKFDVYARPKDPQGRTVIKEETPDGRTTHWVPDIQKADITLQSALF